MAGGVVRPLTVLSLPDEVEAWSLIVGIAIVDGQVFLER